jgi:hypothetical protein
MTVCVVIHIQNTDQQALFSSLAGVKLPLGQSSTGGLGAGGRYIFRYDTITIDMPLIILAAARCLISQ